MEKKKTMYVLMLAYGVLAASISTCIYGLNHDLYIGLGLGIASLMINYWLLMYVIEGITIKNLTFSVLPIGLSRFIIFGIAGWLCFRQSHLCVLMFAISILAMPASALIESLWEVEDGCSYGRG